ncbi:MAG: 50S ribosomal protein L25/general stress protein Ctc [Chitinivorax sp.]
MNFEVIAQARAEQGSGASRRLRNAGRVPAIVYGAGKDAQAVTLDHNSIYHALRVEAFHASVLSLNIDGQVEKVLLRDVQHHPFRQLVLHVDFQRVDPNAKLHIKVPLHFVNADVAPGVKLGGGIISHVANEVDVSCLPADLPEFIEVDLANLGAGQSIHMADLKLPKGVELVALHRGDNQTVANCSGKAGGEEAAE